VISETFFASNYASVWRVLTPSMENFVRRWNMDGYEREWPPLATLSAPGRRGVVNEAGFIFFCKLLARSKPVSKEQGAELLIESFAESAAYVSGSSEPADAEEPALPERREAIAIAGRLHSKFSRPNRKLVQVSPNFKGCGIISACRGDVLVNDDQLFEVKSGDRPFRSVDYRQLAIYVALHFAERRKVLSSIHLLNPRRGTRIDVATETFAREVSGQSAVAFCQTVIDSFSANLISE
jgi:hypothetical protein